MKIFYTILLIFVTSIMSGQQLKSPEEFFYLPFGEQFIPHHQMVDYFQYVANQKQNVVFSEYGRTPEGRPLINVIISSQENINNLEEIRKKHLQDLGVQSGKGGNDKGIVYLSYNVHGNESSGVNTAIKVLSKLVTPVPEIEKQLEDLVIIIDPCINPDGYQRYTNWYLSVASKNIDSKENTREHMEPWPGGRTNHYYFDLNRDWAWQTQQESKQRMAFYHRWLPHIHSDYHEQHHSRPYYFAPAAKPIHEIITNFQKEFQEEIGKNNAYYFDDNKWHYFTKEIYDLLYPSYGDTYPSYLGAIGMTFEQGGSGKAGRKVEQHHNDTLTLSERIEHHVTTTFSTLEVAARGHQKLIDEQNKFFSDAINGSIKGYKNFIIKTDNEPESKIRSFCNLLQRNGINIQLAEKGQNISGYSFLKNKSDQLSLNAYDLVISTAQPNGNLVKALLEPEPFLEDSLTYDITAWSLLHAYGWNALATKKEVKTRAKYMIEDAIMNQIPAEKPYAIIADWNSVESAKLLAHWQEAKLFVRSSEKPFEIEGKKFGAGTIILNAADNKNQKAYYQKAIKIANSIGHKVYCVETGWSESGSDLGSATMKLLYKPEVLIIGGKGIDPKMYGSVWHYMDEVLDYTAHYSDLDNIKTLNLSDYNVIILPPYNGHLKYTNELIEWTKNGGRLILMNRAISHFTEQTGWEKENRLKVEKKEFEDRKRDQISASIFGAVVDINIDNTHPLGFGMPRKYRSLKTNSFILNKSESDWNVGVVANQPIVAGFAGHRLKEQLPNTANWVSKNYGRGKIIGMVDNPLFRGFWYNGFLIMANAIFQDQ